MCAFFCIIWFNPMFQNMRKFIFFIIAQIWKNEPYFDEDYGGEYDDKLDELGKKYDVWVKMESGIYGK